MNWHVWRLVKGFSKTVNIWKNCFQGKSQIRNLVRFSTLISALFVVNLIKRLFFNSTKMYQNDFFISSNHSNDFDIIEQKKTVDTKKNIRN